MGRKKKILVSENEQVSLSDNLDEPMPPPVRIINEGLEDDRLTSLKKVMGDINKKYKTQAIKFAKDEPAKLRIAFGVEQIDKFTGGGVQCGNVTVVYGAEQVGKSTLCLELIANAQKLGKVCAYIDLEHSFTVDRAIQFGVDVTKLVLIEEIDTAEKAMDITIKLSSNKVVDLIVCDSIQAMTPKHELQDKAGDAKSTEDESMALLARKLGQFLRMSGPYIYQGNVALVLIGQVRTQGIGSFITKLGLSGGHAVKHWSVLTLYMRKGQGADAPTENQIIDGEKEKVKIGFDLVVNLEKTKVGGSEVEGQNIHLPFYFKTGFRAKEDVDGSN